MADHDQAAPWAGQSATLLAQQEPESEPLKSPTAPQRKPVKGWQTIHQHLESRMNWMRTKRWAWWNYARLIAEFIVPDRYHYFIVADRTNRDGIISHAIIDGSPTQYLEICGSGLWSGITNPSRPWFKISLALPWVELDQPGQEWLEDTQQRISTVLAQSNFYDTAAQLFADVSAFGTSPMIIYENDETVILCYLPCPGEYFLQVGSTYEVDVLYREYTSTNAQIVEQFGVENCPISVANAWSRGGSEWDREQVVCHAIEPNSDLRDFATGEPIEVAPKAMPYREVYWLRGEEADGYITITGAHEKPFVTARWSKVSNDAYAPTCPGMKALGDVQQLQLQTRRAAELLEKGVRPPMGADVSLKNQPASITPGSTTYMETVGGTIKKYFPLYEVVPAWFSAVTANLEKISQRISKYFYTDLFFAITQMEGVQPRNELELSQRNLERLQVIGRPISLMNKEFCSPAIRRVLSIMQRKGLLKPLPDSLKGIPLKLDYIGLLQLAQTSAEQVSMKDFAQMAGEISEASIAGHVPNPLRDVDWGKFLRKYASLAHVDPDLLFTVDQVKANDQAVQQHNAQQQAIPQGMAAVQAASVLGKTPSGPGTLLHSIIGQPGAAGSAPQPPQGAPQ
jgi:Bacteriophage head to tail connecting protein